MALRLTLAPRAAQQARALTSGDLVAVSARPAATVLLVRQPEPAGPHPTGPDESGRDEPGAVEVLMVRRSSGMVFGGMLAFPGGAVKDSEGTGEPAARRAAVREVLEETGVLIGAHGDLDRSEIVRLRAELVAIDSAGAADREPAQQTRAEWPQADWLGSSLTFLARWITPAYEPRRFDTWFFVAELPFGQLPFEVSGEADHWFWASPGDVLQQLADGTHRALAPTYAALARLAGARTVAAALALRGESTPVEPGWVDDGTDVFFVLPGDPLWPGDFAQSAQVSTQ